MPRAPRIEYGGAVYHVMNRGDRRETVFYEDADRRMFLGCLAEACERTHWQVHAYVLMPNHFHLLLETPEPNLVAGMKWLLGTYTQRFNRKHDLCGHLFQGRYKALVMDEGEDGYIQRVGDYVHLNPARADLIRPKGAPLCSYVWSSLPVYVGSPTRRPRWLRANRVLGAHGWKDSPAGRRRYQAYIEARAVASQDPGRRSAVEAEWKDIRRGWYLGSSEFRDRLLDSVETVVTGQKSESYSGEAVHQHAERSAEQAVLAGMKRLRISEARLAALPKSAPDKSVLAWYASRSSTVSQTWLAMRLHMGSRSSVAKGIMKVKQGQDANLNRLRDALIGGARNK